MLSATDAGRTGLMNFQQKKSIGGRQVQGIQTGPMQMTGISADAESTKPAQPQRRFALHTRGQRPRLHSRHTATLEEAVHGFP
mmetsp:Transcript_111258/g.202339  ORF Transcript_111258/g.202339 Transcript_111258/m.202339 type:complete len:83 (-) Transcript_111258:7-255(-)